MDLSGGRPVRKSERNAGGEPAARSRDEHRIEPDIAFCRLLDRFEPRCPLPGDDLWMLERRYDNSAALFGDPIGDLFPAFALTVIGHDFRAIGTGIGFL